MTQAQDPDELFDIVDAQGVPTGQQKRRADVHRDGDWHRSLHLWLVGGDGRDAWMLFQQRGQGKDTFPGMLDSSVAGHLSAGETVWDALRETEEEIGLPLTAADVELIGTRLIATDQGDTHDYEIQDIFLSRVDDPLSCCVPNPAELEAVIQVTTRDILPVLSGQEAWCWGQALHADGTRNRMRITRDLIIPRIDGYFLKVALAAQDWLAGRDVVRI